jgi:hypothetical protein
MKKQGVPNMLLRNLLILPVPNLEKTSDFYTSILGFRDVKYLNYKEPHICLYKENIEIILIKSKLKKIIPNRIIHGYGYDGYFTGDGIDDIYQHFISNGAKIVKQLCKRLFSY